MPTAIPITLPAGAAVWHLDGAASEYGPWEPVNGGTADRPVQGTFPAGHQFWRVTAAWTSGAAQTLGTGRVDR